VNAAIVENAENARERKTQNGLSRRLQAIMVDEDMKSPNLEREMRIWKWRCRFPFPAMSAFPAITAFPGG
jgi:hypothetical protein